MKIAISAESTVDLSQELLKEYQIFTIPYSIVLGDTCELDGVITPRQIFDYVQQNKNMPKTSAINAFQFEEYFKNLLKTYDAVIHISLSDKLSLTYSTASQVSESFKNVFIINSQTLSSGIALLALYAAKLAKAQKTPEEIVKAVHARIPHVQASFILERLDFLYKGGRCSALQLFGANLFKIKPQIYLKDGAMHVGKKYFGRTDRAIQKYCMDTLASKNKPDLDVAFITYTTATPEMLNEARAALQKAGFKKIYETLASATISCHCGEHTLGILYINDGGINEK